MSKITRRGLMRKGALTTAAAVGMGAGARQAGYEPGIGRSQAIAPLVGLGLAAGAAGVGYIASEAVDTVLGDSRDYSGYTGSTALHTEITAGGYEMMTADERVMTSIQNNITTSENAALAKGKAAIVESLNNGSTETQASSAMQKAIDAYYSNIQTNILRHISEQVEQYAHMREQVATHSNIDTSAVFTHDNAGDARDFQTIKMSVNLLDGSTEPLTCVHIVDDGRMTPFLWFSSENQDWGPTQTHLPTTDDTFPVSSSAGALGFIDVDDGSKHQIYNGYGGTNSPPRTKHFFRAWNDLIVSRDNVNSTLTGFVSDVFANWSSGEIPTEQLVDPITAATQLQQDYDSQAAQGAQAAMIGMPTTAKKSVDMTIKDPNEGDISISTDLYTNHQPTDGSGNSVDYTTGETYQPSTWTEPLYVTYSETDPATGRTTHEFSQLETPFVIDSVTDADGNSVSSFAPQSQNTQTADVSALKDELDQIRQTQIDIQEESQDATGGAGGFLSGNVGRTGLLAAGGAVLLAAFGLSGGS